MADDGRTGVSRRACLAAGVGGVAFLAGCPGQEGPTASDGATEKAEETADATTDDATGPTETSEAAPNPPETGEAVLVDQVGYRPGDEKVAVVRTEAESFQVVDVEDESVVASGDLGDPIDDANSGDTVRRADFTDVTEPGTYVLAVGDGTVASHEFAVEEGVWGETLAEVCRAYTLKRSNIDVDDDVTGLDVGPGHTQDAEAAMYFSDPYHDAGETIDVAGGWYDAGDYGKYVPPAAVTVAQLLLAYEQNPDVFEQGQLALDAALAEGNPDGDLPDLLAEVKFELEWLETMQRRDGAVYHKVSGTDWPGFVAPTEDTRDRYVFGLSTYGTAQYAGAMAMAARVYSDHDPGFADRARENAEAAWSYLRDNPEPYFRRDEGQDNGSGGYEKSEAAGDAEERFWAAAELLRTTGAERYADYLQSEHPDQFTASPSPVGWHDASLLGQWAYYTADAADDDWRAEVGTALVDYADDLVERVESEGYNVSLTAEEYYWSSAKVAVAKGNVLLLANEVEPEAAYLAAARDQVHYVLGRTPTGHSYVTGAGENPPRNTHDRIRASTGTYVPGYLVGGPNSDGGDPALDEYIASEDPAPAKCYLDEQPSYASNEWAVDYSAPLVFALAHFTPAEGVDPGA